MLSAHLQQQTEQANGYWLSNWTLTKATQLPINFQFELNGQTYHIFSQKTAQSFQCLSQLKTQPQTQPQTYHFDLKNTQPPKKAQAWLFFSDFKKQLKPNHPLCLLAEENTWSQAFYLAQALKPHPNLMIILAGKTQDFPFQVKPARYLLPELPPEAANMIGACPLLEDWGILNRLCHTQGLPGCFDGNLTQFLSLWHPKNQQYITLTA